MTHVTIIAEAGVNHNGDIKLAYQLIDVAASAGVDYVKFQSFKADKLVDRSAQKADYQKASSGADESQYDMLKRLELSESDHDSLIAYCRQKGVKFLSTPFDESSIELLVSKGIEIGKIPSGEVTNKPYLVAMARAFKHIIISTGMCTMEEILAAKEVLLQAGTAPEDLIILHCNTEYPTPMADVNLKAMNEIRSICQTKVGYSDHTLGIEVPVAAVALGAVLIEKHFTLDKTLPGPDHKASLEPNELIAMVKAIRNIELATGGSGNKAPSDSEKKNLAIARKSIHLAQSLEPGTVIQTTDLIMLRPGDGISPMEIDKVIGKKIRLHLNANEKLRWEHLEG